MASTNIELMMSHGWLGYDVSKAAPSAVQGYWDIRSQWMQPFLGQSGGGFFNATTGTGFSAINAGGTATGTAGTISTPTLASTNILTQCRRTVSTSTAAINSSASVFGPPNPANIISSTARYGGFVHCYRFANSTTVATNRCFVGLSNVGDPIVSGNLGNSGYFFGFGFDSGDLVADGFYFMSNNNSTRTKTQVAAMSRTASTVLEVWIGCAPGSTTVTAWVWDLTNDAEAYPITSTSTNVPTDQWLYSTMSLNTGPSSTSSVVMNWIRWETLCPW